MKHYLSPRFQPRLETLEERCTPSTLQAPFVIPHGFQEHQVGPICGGAHHSDTITVPFKINGGGSAPDGLPLFATGSGPHDATGRATYLGNYTGDGTFVLDSLAISATGQVTGTFHGSFVFVAANGDHLAFTYGDGATGKLTGQVSADGTTVLNVKFDAVFTADPENCTGRFANVTGGSFRMIANSDSISLISTVPGYTAAFEYTWSGEGSLEFSKGKK